MKLLFDRFSSRVSKIITESYSTSFSLGILYIDRKLRNHIYAIYGFVRTADEIVDSFEGFDKKSLLEKFQSDTWEALENRISVNPILNSFQYTVHRYQIDYELIELFFQSMEMDLQRLDYNLKTYEQYILGSAEVVGLMCLHVFTERNKKAYNELKPYAMKLGSAFQKVNFLRDLKDDFQILGRSYFPNIDIMEFSRQAKKEIEDDIEQDFQMALPGIKMLPLSSRTGVYLAYVYYLSLFKKIKRLPVQRLLTERVRINNGKKIGLMFNSLFAFTLKSA
jgi:phytoene/squalene synthetase